MARLIWSIGKGPPGKVNGLTAIVEQLDPIAEFAILIVQADRAFVCTQELVDADCGRSYRIKRECPIPACKDIAGGV